MKRFAAALVLAALVQGAAANEEALGIKVHKQGGINYITGGLGEEAHAFAEVAQRYPVQLFFTVDGEHAQIRDVKVVVRDVKGDVTLEAKSDGPLFYLDTPSGRWTFEVEWNGQKQTKTKDQTGRRYLVLDFDFKKPD
ncbi:MAG: hypothetical protein ABI794_07750 [Betaproteobacteria bacterium]